MKKLKDILFLFLIGCVVLSCSTRKGQSSKEATQSTAEQHDSVSDVPTASQIYGIAGDGCAMHTLEIITAQHDTLDLNMETARDSGLVIGDIFIGNRYTLTLTADKENVKTAVNLTQLVGKWRLNGIDSGFSLHADGKAESHNMKGLAYSQWRISDNKLLLRTMNDSGRKEAFTGVDTLYLKDLTEDSLIVVHYGRTEAYARVR